MLSINTNLSSLIAQNSMNSSTNALNIAIERMTTGYKINHAKDNAANYSISTNMTTKLNSYNVAADNVAMGMDLVTTASDTVSLMQDKAARLRALSTQARNGTFGAQSLAAINTEANAIVAEINRIYSTAQCNGISLFTGSSATTEATPAVATFALARSSSNSELRDTTSMVTMTELVSGKTSANKEYSISTEAELIALAEYVNGGKSTSGMTFVLGANLDLGEYCDEEIANGNGGWTPIGNSSYQFKGTFDGNGHVIENLKIDREANGQGLFGYIGDGTNIKNVGLEGGSVKGQHYVGGLVGYANFYYSSSSSSITNCYATGSVTGNSDVGGLVGSAGSASSISITDSYATGSVTGNSDVGGLVGCAYKSSITNSYATGVVTGTNSGAGGLVGSAGSSSSITNSYATGSVTGGGSSVGGLVGCANSTSITDSYATGSVKGHHYVGGLVGYADSSSSGSSSSITNSYATGSVNGTDDNVGGLVGYANFYYSSSSSITNSYATGDVTGTKSFVGGLVGHAIATSITDSYATGSVTGGGSSVGGLVGCASSSGSSSSSITNSYATGSVTGGGSCVGGLVGDIAGSFSYSSSSSITNSYATGSVTADYSDVGGLVGRANSSSITNSYATGSVTGDYHEVGGLVGQMENSSITNSYATGSVTGDSFVGGLVGSAGSASSITNSAAVQTDTYATLMTAEEIRATYTFEAMGFTEANGWTIVKDTPLLSWQKEAQAPDLTIGGGNSFYLQVGVNGDSSCQIGFNINFTYDLSALEIDIASDDSLATIDNFISLLSEKATQLGAVQNRLESALESISVNIENLTSSRSTIRDADIAEVSSRYIQQQILQQAAATLMSTANQSPAIALQLI